MKVNTDIKQVAIILKGTPIPRQKLYVGCATAFLGAYEEARKTRKEWVEKWNNGGYMKIVLKCPTNDLFVEIFNQAVARHLPMHISDHVMAIGPVPSSIIDKLTGNLKLY